MLKLKRFFDFYLDASIHVGFAVGSLVWISCLLLNIMVSNALLLFTFFGTIVCYNFIKYGVEAKKYLIVSKSYHRKIQLFSFFSFLLALFFLSQLGTEVWAAVFGLSVLSLVYALPFLPNARNLRSLAGFKIYIVGLVWTGITVVLPILQVQRSLDWDIGVFLVQRFVLIILLMLPFEIRDMQSDYPGLRTVPQVLGLQRTKILGFFLILVFWILTFLRDSISVMEITARTLLSLVLLLVFLGIKQNQPKYLASFWIEAIPMFWMISIFIVRELG